jgi:hypothetical protein
MNNLISGAAPVYFRHKEDHGKPRNNQPAAGGSATGAKPQHDPRMVRKWQAAIEKTAKRAAKDSCVRPSAVLPIAS